MGRGGFTVDWLIHGREVDNALRREAYDCIVLDLGLPDIDGEQVLVQLRRTGQQLPVVVITAREEVADRIRLLDLGADDLIVKPVHLDELAARLRAVMRRRGSPETELRHGPLRVVPATRTVLCDGTHVPVTTKEFWVLETLMRNRDLVTPREQLEEALWGFADEVASNAVEVHVHHLRRKLGSDLIRTVRGVGYRLRPER
jgi:DNA-binding response OmpR family regulator